MAGYKYVNRAYYNSLNGQLADLESRVANANSKLNNEKTKYNNTVSQSTAQVNNAVNRVNSDIKNATDRIFSDMQDVSENMREEIGRLKVRTGKQVAEIKNDISATNRRVDQVDNRIDAISAEYAGKLREISNTIESRKTRAIFYRNMLNEALAQVEPLYPQKLASEDYNFLSGISQFVEDDIKNGDFQAATALAQQAVVDAHRLRVNLEVIIAAYENVLNSLTNMRSAIDAKIQNYKEPDKNKLRLDKPYEDAVEEFDGNIFYWADYLIENLVSVYYNECNTIDDKLISDMDVEGLEAALQVLEKIPTKLEGCKDVAHAEFYIYDRVSEMMYNIHNALTADDYWHLKESGFVDDDSRGVYHAVYSPFSDAFDVSVMVLPNRPVKSRNKTRKGEVVEYGPVQVRINVDDSQSEEHIRDSHLCEQHRAAVLGRLRNEAVDIDFAELCRDFKGNCLSTEFVNRVNQEGQKSRQTRLNMEGDKLGIT